MQRLQKIEINVNQLYGLLIPRIGKKQAKALAFPKTGRNTNWKQSILMDAIGHSLNLKDIRLLRLFGCTLTAKQTVALQYNKQEYSCPSRYRY